MLVIILTSMLVRLLQQAGDRCGSVDISFTLQRRSQRDQLNTLRANDINTWDGAFGLGFRGRDAKGCPGHA